MANTNLEKLLDNIRTINFWGRLFGWARIKDQLMAAAADLERLKTTCESLQERSNTLSHNIDLLNQKNEHLRTEQTRLTSEQLTTLKQLQDRIHIEREREKADRHQAGLDRLEALKSTWYHHEEQVKHTLKVLCSKHTIHYLDKVPFKGEPDNTVSVGGEFIVFDAKSPRGEDLGNFPAYLREQSEKIKKYTGQENVKSWVFFVVPANTLEALRTHVYQLADYDVFVVTVDALEPILLSLRKVEEYEFADQLSPDDRENICRVLGKFAHLSKRRVQIDTYFISQFMELAYKCENDLPQDILEKAAEFERAEKLSLPQGKRGKSIPMSDLQKAVSKVHHDAANKGIALEESRLTDGLNDIPLYS